MSFSLIFVLALVLCHIFGGKVVSEIVSYVSIERYLSYGLLMLKEEQSRYLGVPCCFVRICLVVFGMCMYIETSACFKDGYVLTVITKVYT